ncbi:ferredoxin [Candidatus Omnitrophus magneticus]|uniref:Ferredoxin n=1 Tax=Candidatus Omnitrophus magneticus TaxID=1609969 RepID=A0A0F0CRI6_9BACT|nr:ferredoxin [Candidatus Omnitrophus magneticus]
MSMGFEKIRKSALKDVAEFMCVSARTAPKARGTDNLVIMILDESEKEKIIQRMKKISERDSRPSFLRDAGNIVHADYIVLIGTKSQPLGLNCGFCGKGTCEELKKIKGVCAINSMDLGIAIGSSVSIAGAYHVDNRLMFSIGKAAMEENFFIENVAQAIGIPLSATGKNPFFDRT